MAKGRSREIARTGERPIRIIRRCRVPVHGELRIEHGHQGSIPHKSVPDVLDTVTVRSPGNSAAWIIPVLERRYPSQEACLAAFPSVRAIIARTLIPAVQSRICNILYDLAAVGYEHQIAENELTVSKWVDFLNTVDRDGKNRHHLWDAAQSSRVWPEVRLGEPGTRVLRRAALPVASPEWANKPYNVADFTRAARLANSLDNGKLVRRRPPP